MNINIRAVHRRFCVWGRALPVTALMLVVAQSGTLQAAPGYGSPAEQIRAAATDPEPLDYSDFALESLNNIESPRSRPRLGVPANAPLSLKGWAVDRKGESIPSLVVATVAGRIFPCESGLQRNDVAEFLKNVAYANSGFRCEIPALNDGSPTFDLYIQILLKSGRTRRSAPFPVHPMPPQATPASPPRLVAQSTPNTPASHPTSANLILSFLLSVVCLWVPAAIFARYVCAGFELGPQVDTPVTLIAAGTFCQLAFWASYANPSLSFVWPALLWIAAAAILARTRGLAASIFRDRFFLAMVLCGVLYTATLDRFESVHTGGELVERLFSFEPRSIDNLLPQWFFEAIRKGPEFRTGYTFGDWTFSDRPPLQTGALFLLQPLATFLTPDSFFLASSIACQLFWIPGLLAFAAVNGTSARKNSGLAVLLLILTGFCYFNSVYTWPKLLGAGMVLATLCLAEAALAADNARYRTVCFLLAGVGAGDAFLAHAGTGVTVAAAALWYGARIVRRIPARAWLPGLAAALLTILPWIWYVRQVDPPGDRLLKWHFGAQKPLTAASFPELALKAYSEPGISGLLALRMQHTAQLFRDSALEAVAGDTLAAWQNGVSQVKIPPDKDRYYLGIASIPATLSSLAVLARYDQLEVVFRSLGLLILGVPLLLVQILRKSRPGPSPAGTAVILALIAVSVLLVFQNSPGSFRLRNIDATTIVLLGYAGCFGVLSLPRALAAIVCTAHVALQLFIWAIVVPAPGPESAAQITGRNYAFDLIALVAAAGLAWVLLRYESRSTEIPALASVPRRIALAAGALPLATALVAFGVVAFEAQRPILVDVTGVDTPERLFASFDDSVPTVSVILRAAVLRFSTGQLLSRVLVRMPEAPQPGVRMTVEAEVYGGWHLLRDGLATDTGKIASVPVGVSPVRAIRIGWVSEAPAGGTPPTSLAIAGVRFKGPSIARPVARLP